MCLDIAEGAVESAEDRLPEVVRLADELSADDLRAAAAILRGRRPDPATRRTDLPRVHAFVGDHLHLAEAVAQQPLIPVNYATAAYWVSTPSLGRRGRR
ncbi:hypothetical protein ACGFY9_47450 [Streptomyces sp. NPDC048504]|uniref:hypothetical protein n=1 Tax=Streptomyces sp. NPDC048504 TaxID=3365559 RepID=UPI0037224DA1